MAFPQLRASIPNATTTTDANNVVCTHPTGLTAGDLMILYVAFDNFGSDRTINTPSGWTQIRYFSLDDRKGFAAYYKVASAGDVSAGSTVVGFSGIVGSNSYAMFAVSGAASGFEITLSEMDDLTNPSGATTFDATTAITPAVSESLIFSAFLAVDFNLSAQLTASSFSLTPTTSLTERVDTGYRDGASDGHSLFVATAEYSGVTEITSRGVTVSESITSDVGSIFFLVNAPQNVTADISHLAVTPTVQGVTASEVNVVTDVGHLAIVPSVEVVEARVPRHALVTNVAKPAASTVDNQPK